MLKVFGFREYLKGNLPMLSYQRVRENLRGFKYLKVKLIEIKEENSAEQLYPPVISRNQELMKLGFNKKID